MHWNTLKIVTVVALLASPSAFAAIPDPGTLGGADRVETPRQIQLANHAQSNRWSNHRRPHEARGDRDDGRRFDRHGGRPNFRGHPPRHYRGHPPWHYRGHPPRRYRGYPPRRYRGWPIRRLFRHWRRHH